MHSSSTGEIEYEAAISTEQGKQPPLYPELSKDDMSSRTVGRGAGEFTPLEDGRVFSETHCSYLERLSQGLFPLFDIQTLHL